MNRKALVVAGFLVIATGAFYLWSLQGSRASSGLKAYASPILGLSFQYPDTYMLEEHNLWGGERTHHSIALIPSEDLPYPKDGEGPPTITIEAIQNNLDHYSAESFVRDTSFSNFKLSPSGILSATTIANEPALRFEWSGLYEGESIVVARENWVYVFSSTHLTPEDEVIAEFQHMLTTVHFE